MPFPSLHNYGVSTPNDVGPPPTSPLQPSLSMSIEPTPPSNSPPTLVTSKSDSPRKSNTILLGSRPPRISRARTSSFEPQSIDNAKDMLDDMQVRSEEFSDMLDLLLQIGKGTTLRDAEASIMSASCEIVKANR